MQGLTHSAVQEQDHIRKEAVQKLIHQFETHPNREALQADLKPKEMILSMGTYYLEIFDKALYNSFAEHACDLLSNSNII